MIYEYAVDPELFIDKGIIRLFYESFGKEKGRLISDMPTPGWHTLVTTVIKANHRRQRERKKMNNLLIQLKRRALYKRHACMWNGDDGWLQNVQRNHQQQSFHGILSDHEVEGDFPILANDWSLSEQDLWKCPGDCTVDRRAAVMVETMQSMLNCAKEVILVDRNFDPNKLRFRRVMLEIIQSVIKNTQQPSMERIAYHVGDERDIERGCIDKIKPVLPVDVSVDFYIWPKSELHARFVLTDIGGVLVEHGLDEYDGPGTQEILISRLSEDTYKKWWIFCHARAPDFSISADP